MKVQPLMARSFAKETLNPYENAPEITITAEITKYDAATEKRMAEMAKAETSSPYDLTELIKDPEAGDVPKWTTDFWKITRHDMAH
eukprot:CAMPEP_0197520158 /NCGR_PEP_ID=MMETSP1318-20131121/5469_1 /TAXON_ID=552666 /ORGANISM="Partenskyella glossopodia, Strain RCC365" /LENGTH=85 /DNA_ID=CAMNT_0043071561 /DNA_START=75 /DNA_END=332 /DNA_ORIENTATION=+